MPAFAVSSVHHESMSRTPTDKEISLKAVAFYRKHFADGSDPAPERIVQNHKRLKDDPKLLTRLVPRFISALAFFEGYKQACAAHEPTIVECEDRLRELQGDESDDPKNIGIVIKPPPPPPPAAAPPIVQLKLENDKPIANDELRTGIDDELAQAAVKYANDTDACMAGNYDVALVRDVVIRHRDSGSRDWDWYVRSFIAGAIWQSARMENVAGEDPPNVHELREENERLKQRLVFFEISEDERTKSKLAWLNSLDGEPTTISKLYVEDGKVMFRGVSGQTSVVASSEPNRDVSLAPTPIVFRDDDERDYWDSVSLTLAKKQETTAQSVASGADEMVEERRLRNPLAKQVRDELHDAESDGHRYNAFLLDGKLRVTHYKQTTEYDVENDERFKGKPAKKIAWIIRHELCDREDTPSTIEPSDELLQRAIDHAIADPTIGQPSWPRADNLQCARHALINPDSGHWSRAVHSYVAGALGK